MMKTIVALVVALLIFAFLVNAMKRSTLFFPDRFPDGDWDVARLAIQPQDHLIETPDGVRLHAWHFAAADPSAALMIWFHGNGGNLSHRADFAVELARRGVAVLLFDYRGYGKSEGRPTEGGLYIDALAVHDYATKRLGIPPDRIVAYGESLGGPYAAYVSAKRKVRCVVIENSFHSAASVANAIYKVPIGIFLGRSLSAARWLNVSRAPTLVMHGKRDQVIPFRAGMDLYDALEGPKQLFVSETARHCEMPVVDGERYYETVIGFIRAQGSAIGNRQ